MAIIVSALVVIGFFAWYHDYKLMHPSEFEEEYDDSEEAEEEYDDSEEVEEPQTNRIELRDEYLDRLIKEHYLACFNASCEAAAQANEARNAKLAAKERKAEQVRELASFEREHREVMRDKYYAQYSELMEERKGAGEKRRAVIDRKIEQLEEKQFKNDFAISKLYYKGE